MDIRISFSIIVNMRISEALQPRLRKKVGLYKPHSPSGDLNSTRGGRGYLPYLPVAF